MKNIIANFNNLTVNITQHFKWLAWHQMGLARTAKHQKSYINLNSLESKHLF